MLVSPSFYPFLLWLWVPISGNLNLFRCFVLYSKDVICNFWRRVFFLLKVILNFLASSHHNFCILHFRIWFKLWREVVYLSLWQEGLYVGQSRLHMLHSLIILGYILKHGFFKSGLFLFLSQPLILHGLRPMHSLILLEALSLIEIVGVLIIRIVPSHNKVDLIQGCI